MTVQGDLPSAAFCFKACMSAATVKKNWVSQSFNFFKCWVYGTIGPWIFKNSGTWATNACIYGVMFLVWYTCKHWIAMILHPQQTSWCQSEKLFDTLSKWTGFWQHLVRMENLESRSNFWSRNVTPFQFLCLLAHIRTEKVLAFTQKLKFW